jgi:hypothetical protein
MVTFVRDGICFPPDRIDGFVRVASRYGDRRRAPGMPDRRVTRHIHCLLMSIPFHHQLN